MDKQQNDMMRKSMLYIMGIDWEWIHQRPQIFAEKLAADYQVTVVFPRSIVSRKRELPKTLGIEFRILWTIPFQEKNVFLGWISKLLNKKLFRDIEDFQYVFIGYPLYARYIPKDYCGKIIYDCMDNHEALYPDQKRVEKVLEQERELIKRSNVLLASAKKLQEKVDAVAGRSSSVLVRNGVEVDAVYEVKQAEKKDKYSLCYVGTISGWFDYDLIQNSLEVLGNIEYHLIGPTEIQVKHSRIKYHGPKPHDLLGEAVKEYDCLIMPFRVNEIVESVDPVKLYEYIAFGKCIISVYYPEIERFDEFIYFYKNQEEYVRLLKELSKDGFPPKYSKYQQQAFLQENSWNKRYEQLKAEIDATSVYFTGR